MSDPFGGSNGRTVGKVIVAVVDMAVWGVDLGRDSLAGRKVL